MNPDNGNRTEIEQVCGLTMSRRRLLQRAGWLLAGTAVWPALARAAEKATSPGTAPVISPVMEKLSTYMAAACDRALPDDVVEQAKYHILDTLSAMISGSQLPPGKLALEFAQKYGGEKIATVAASSIRCGPIEAALANGMLAHSDETDDSHAPSHCHPGCAIVPAALAAGEQFRISGTHFLRAVTLGYDIGPRVTMTLGGLPFKSPHEHMATHCIATNFGATAAAACTAALDARQMRWVLDYAAQQASGTLAWQRDTDHIQKSLVFAGIGARNGVTAAILVRMGGTGVDDILSGDDNFLLAFAPKADANVLIEKLGERYEIARTNIKKWTVGSPIQAPLDALEILMKNRPFTADQVQKVVVRLAINQGTIVDNRAIPDICLQHMIAVMLIDKTVTFQAAHDKPRMQDPAVLRQRAKVQLILDEELERRWPGRESIVTVTLADGTELSHHVLAVRGTAENPMNREEVVAKCRDLVSPVLGTATCKKLVAKVLELEKTKDIREIGPLLQRT
jgi:2-methylcitrate dehydratase PrpD